MEKNIFLAEGSIEKNITSLFQKMKKKSKVNIGGENSGMVAYAIWKYLHQKYDIDISIGLMTDAEDENDLIDGESSIYQMFPIINNRMYNESGELTTKTLLDISKNQYKDNDPSMFTFFLPQEESDIVKIILRRMNYDTNWKYFFDLL